jgi:hypothetical protein
MYYSLEQYGRRENAAFCFRRQRRLLVDADVGLDRWLEGNAGLRISGQTFPKVERFPMQLWLNATATYMYFNMPMFSSQQDLGGPSKLSAYAHVPHAVP